MGREFVVRNAENFVEALQSTGAAVDVTISAEEDFATTGFATTFRALWDKVPAIPDTINTHYLARGRGQRVVSR